MTLSSPVPLIREDPYFPHIKGLVIERTGLAYYVDREADLARRLQLRLQALQLRDCQSYLAVLQKPQLGEEEFDALVAELTIGETHFFRHREMFDALRNVVLPQIIARNRRQRSIRVWSAGCSIGAEAYSIAILIRELLGSRISSWDISILGTDINRTYLKAAHVGQFDEWALRSVADDTRRKHFEPAGEGWTLRPPYRQHVTFRHHNLIDIPPGPLLETFDSFDLILCRNVMIYFNEKTNQRLAEALCRFLAEDGWLAVGHAELQGNLFKGLRAEFACGATVYQKGSGGSEESPRYARTSTEGTLTVPTRFITTPVGAAVPSQTPRHFEPARGRELSLEESLAGIRRLADEGRLPDAILSCETLLHNHRHSSQVNLHYALLMEQAGQLQEAERWIRKAVYLDPQSALATFFLGVVQLRRGEQRAAARALTYVMELTHRLAPGAVEGAEELQLSQLQQMTRNHLTMIGAP